jgi:hypothetical protein
MKKEIKCKLSDCLNNEECKCTEFIPTIVSKIIPNKIECPYYENEEMNKKLKALRYKKSFIQTTEETKEIEKVKKKIKKQKKQKKVESKNQLKNKKGLTFY